MTLIDIKAVKDEAEKEFRKERENEAKKRLKAQMKVVADLEVTLANEKRKLEDIITAIAEGN